MGTKHACDIPKKESHLQSCLEFKTMCRAPSIGGSFSLLFICNSGAVSLLYFQSQSLIGAFNVIFWHLIFTFLCHTCFLSFLTYISPRLACLLSVNQLVHMLVEWRHLCLSLCRQVDFVKVFVIVVVVSAPPGECVNDIVELYLILVWPSLQYSTSFS